MCSHFHNIVTSRGAIGVTISTTSSSLTSTAVSTEITRSFVRYCIQCSLVTACTTFASSRTFFFSGNLITNLHGMVGCCTSCYIFEFRGASITLPVTQQYSRQRFVFIIRERPEERVLLASGDYDITERSEFDTNAAQFLDCSCRIVLPAAVTCKLTSWSCSSCILDSPSSRYFASTAMTAPPPSPNSAVPTGA